MGSCLTSAVMILAQSYEMLSIPKLRIGLLHEKGFSRGLAIE